ncbi:Crp/Fnr family transcriptional regulator [Roseomonas sp. NAR14]|uniref:Crp/Fnr family transcriptional regulator n=1 Tax=Roseomonas acroporae TaxID=2937791 RepID=A0A9X1YBN1_9PROT|nr:Crp/Fnr family transcriptional regulator [Roseomonas acroporae]MCK8783511.1 Crp/Fnr family transcriptional regulator [Roseomonas acroporae]
MSGGAQAELIAGLAAVGLFRGLPPASLARLAEGARVLAPADGTQLFAQGDAADAAYAVLRCDGRVRVGAPDAGSKRLLVEMFKEGDVFGEIGVLDGTTRSADATVEGRVRLARIRAEDFLHVLETAPALGANLSRLLSSRLRRTFILLQDAAFESLEVRLARQLLYLAERGAQRTPEGLRLAGRFRQGDLADLLGATTRSIITILNNWRGSGLVTYDTDKAYLTLADEARLRRLVQPNG